MVAETDTLPYPDRRSAGRALASLLLEFRDRDDVLVLGLPRGGLPVASEIAAALRCPLDVLVVRKLGLPWQPELAAGAIAPGGILVRNPQVTAYFDDLDEALAPIAAHERRELQRRETIYRRGRPPLDVRGRVIILVDDGIATGATMEAAVLALRALHASSIVVAVPVAPADSVEAISRRADRVVCPRVPEPFEAVGRWYVDFPQLTDAEVLEILAASRMPSAEVAPRRDQAR